MDNNTTPTVQIGMKEAEELTSSHPAVIAAAEAKTAFMFSAMILDEVEPIKLTPEIIRSKSKDLLALTIDSIFDKPGYEAVKKGYNKAVKTRTSIEKLEAPKKKEYKTAYDAKVRELTDYTNGLYAACLEVEENLKAKYTAIDTQITVEAKRLADEKIEKTDGRETAMYAAGMQFNGVAFIGHGKTVTKEMLYGMEDEAYALLVEELDLAEQEAHITGKQPDVVVPSSPTGGGGFSWPSSIRHAVDITPMDVIYRTEYHTLDVDIKIFITRGAIATNPSAHVCNEEINESGFFMQITD